ncbi:RagB/SusD family nutrient uptake outer membrane protein [Paradesertivirga mongoliensis]|uniref:RagB/SusD family nutrient uptake outer membrane protein n=1 Tax=Paradesertivirga mongoliensis TaxID=2100740 RepID=A0ABW4ZS01_9SPHI|nr:RagB/SusD family nutrient uptake outer membrane protein [Pedobacter mongoliensis]
MYKNIIYRILLALIVVSSASCQKWLDVKPQDGLIKQEFWKTKEQLQSAVTGTYISLVDNNIVSQLFRWGELRADLVMVAQVPGKPSNDEIQLGNGNLLPTNSIADWSGIYRVINNCNQVIDNAAGVSQNDPTVSMKEVNESVAEVKAIRALLYFYLLRSYRDVPLQLQGVSEDTQVMSLPKSGPDEVAAQILEDLKFAEEHAVETFVANPSFDKGRITKFAVFAIQADVYLWLDRYEEALQACNKVIESGRFRLVPGDGATFFNDLYFEGNSDETIFAFQYTVERPNPFYSMFQAAAKPLTASTAALDEIFKKDINDPEAKDLRAEGVSFHATDLSIWKYTGKNDKDPREANQSIAKYNIYRYADVLLMKAEALAYIPGNGQAVMDLIDQVRDRARALDVTKQDPDLNNSSSLAQYVFDERGREFAFEGKRWFDLLRFAKRNDYENLDLLIARATLNVPSNLSQSVAIKLSDTNSHYLPVPFRDMQANKNLVQNPFYK